MKSKIPPRPATSGQIDQLYIAPTGQPHKIILVGLILVFVVAASTTLILAYYVFMPQLPTLLHVPTPTISPTATPQCVNDTLNLGPYTYRLDRATLTEEGTLPTLAKPAGSAWWLSDTSNPYLIIFVPAIGSLDMQSALSVGDDLVIQWADCSREVFDLTDFEPGIPDEQLLLSQTSPGIIVIVQPVGGKDEYIIHGQYPRTNNYPTP